MSEQVVQPTIQPTENRRQCLIWTGVLCTIAYALFTLINLSSQVVRDFLSMDEMIYYYRFARMLSLIGGICFVGGMVSLVVFKPNRITPYLGLAGGCLYLMHMFILLFKIDVTEFFGNFKLAFFVFGALPATSAILMGLPVFLLKDRVVSVVRYIGMIGTAIKIELNLLMLWGLWYFAFGGNDEPSTASFDVGRTLSELVHDVATSFSLMSLILIFLFYVGLLACQNKGCEKRCVPYKWYTGRSCGREYWIKVVCLVLIAVVAGIAEFAYVCDVFDSRGLSGGLSDSAGIRFVAYCFSMLWFLQFAIAAIPVSVRRLHDQGLSGWWLLPSVPFLLIPFVGWLVPIIMFVIIGRREGTVGPNQYGPDPKAAERERLVAMLTASSNSTPTPIPTPTPTPAPTLTPTPVATGASSTEDRLVKLQGLKDKGLITEEEYQKKREAILSEL